MKTALIEEKIDEAIYLDIDEQKNIIFTYLVKNKYDYTVIPEDIVYAINSIYTNNIVSKLGLTNEEISSLTPNFILEIEQSKENEANGNNFFMMILSALLFSAIYFCVYQVSTSITTEKTSKIIETLVTSSTPRTIVVGKTLGVGIVGIFQIILITTIAVISAKISLDNQLIEMVLDTSSITPTLGTILLLYFVLGYFAYAFMYAITGSTVDKPEDVQSANTPVALITVAAFYLSYFTMINPQSSLNEFAANFPLSSPFSMPFRYMLGLANIQDVVISLLILIVTIILIAKFAVKIYSSAILNTGMKLNLKNIIVLYKNKN